MALIIAGMHKLVDANVLNEVHPSMPHSRHILLFPHLFFRQHLDHRLLHPSHPRPCHHLLPLRPPPLLQSPKLHGQHERPIHALTVQRDTSTSRKRPDTDLMSAVQRLERSISTLDVSARLCLRDALLSLSNKAANAHVMPTPEQEAMNRAAENLVLRRLFLSGQQVMHTAPGTAGTYSEAAAQVAQQQTTVAGGGEDETTGKTESVLDSTNGGTGGGSGGGDENTRRDNGGADADNQTGD